MQDLPKGLDRISERIRVIDVSNNMLDNLPAVLTPLHGIERLVAANNNISTILCQMDAWSKLRVCPTLSSARLLFFAESMQVAHNAPGASAHIVPGAFSLLRAAMRDSMHARHNAHHCKQLFLACHSTTVECGQHHALQQQ
jgi:hypothetical protein